MERLNNRKTKVYWIHCPHCRKSSKLFLTSRPHLIVLNCPICHQTLINAEGTTHEIDNLSITQVNKKQIKGLFSKFGKQKEIREFPADKLPQILPPEPEKPRPKYSPAPAGLKTISVDDILNIRSALDKTGDVLDFLKRI